MSNHLHQLTMSFKPEQDRMLLRVSTNDGTEFQFWLTRRFIKILWTALLQVIQDKPKVIQDKPKVIQRNPKPGGDLLPGVRDAIIAMEHKEMVQSADFSQKHEEGKVHANAKTGPLLVVGLSVVAIADQKTRITLKTKDGEGLSFGLTKQLLHALCQMVISTTNKAEWNLGLTVGDAAAIIVPDQSRVH